jgi:Flp pilus assembly protein TadD/predicted Ser/Thr protein kinase
MIGQTLAHYTITAPIGAGGMGVVWKAWDSKLERDVAIKTLPVQPDREARRRFLREAQIASALNHPNIVTVYEINSDGETDFIVMEYVRGQTLHQIIKTARPPVAAALGYASQIVEGVARAHAAGIVHRDLKPGNIMVTDEGLIKVLDFGLAKLAPESTAVNDAATLTALTAHGAALGTPAYMSPEQLVADSVDLRSDIFALGIILYELFTGINPFGADTRVDSVKRLLTTSPAAPRSMAHDIPEPLNRVILRCLERRREDRYEHAGALLADLRRIPLHDRPSRRRQRLMTGALLVLLALAVTAGLLWPTRQSGDATSSADGAVTLSPQQLTIAAAEQLRHYYRPKSVDEAIARLEDAIARAPDAAMSYAVLSEAYLLRYLATVDQQWLRFAEQQALKAIDLAPDLAAAHLALARAQFESGRRDEALTTVTRAADLDPRNAIVETTIAKVLAAQGRAADAEMRFGNAVALDPTDWRPATELALFLYRGTRFADAVTRLEQARALAPENQIILRNLSGALIQLDRFDDAASIIQRALEIAPSAALYANLGYIRFYQGRYEEAIPPFENALKLAPNNYRNWGNLGDAYRWTPARKHEAADAYARGITLAREAATASPEDLDVRSSLAVYLAKSDRVAECLEQLRHIAASDRPPAAAVHFKSALAFEIAGDRGNALAAMQRALDAGYPVRELRFEPDLAQMRLDVRYHRLLAAAGKK